jgi:hypothetical protein
VIVDEAGRDEASPEGDDARRRRAVRGDVSGAPHLQQLAITNRHRLGIRPRRIPGPETTAREDEVGLLGRDGKRREDEGSGEQATHDGVGWG